METSDQSNKWQIYESRFHAIAAVILGLTALCKLISAASEARILATPDPIFSFVTMRQLLLLTAGLELAVLVVLVKGAVQQYRNMVVLWLCSVFIGYRAVLWVLNYKGCSCLGTITSWMPVSANTVDWIMKGILAYLTIGSITFLLANWRRGGRVVGTQPVANPQS